MPEDPIFAFHLQDFSDDNENSLNDFNTKCVLLENLLLHENAGTENLKKTKTMLLHDRNLKESYNVIKDKLNAQDLQVYTFINQYMDSNSTRTVVSNNIVNLSTQQDLLLLSIASPYKNIYYYTQNMISIPPCEWTVTNQKIKTTMNLSLLQNTYCTGTSPNDKLAFMRHALVTYYIFDYHTKFIKLERVEAMAPNAPAPVLQPRAPPNNRNALEMLRLKNERMKLQNERNKIKNEREKELEKIKAKKEILKQTLDSVDNQFQFEPAGATLETYNFKNIKQFQVIHAEQKDHKENKIKFLVIEFHHRENTCSLIANKIEDGDTEKIHGLPREYTLSYKNETLTATPIKPITWTDFQLKTLATQQKKYNIIKITDKVLPKRKFKTKQNTFSKLEEKSNTQQIQLQQWLENRDKLFYDLNLDATTINKDNFQNIITVANFTFHSDPYKLFRENVKNAPNAVFQVIYLKDERLRTNLENRLQNELLLYVKNPLRDFQELKHLANEVTDRNSNKSKYLDLLYQERVEKEILKLNNSTTLEAKQECLLYRDIANFFRLKQRHLGLLAGTNYMDFLIQLVADKYNLPHKILRRIQSHIQDLFEINLKPQHEYIEIVKESMTNNNIFEQRIIDFWYQNNKPTLLCTPTMEEPAEAKVKSEPENSDVEANTEEDSEESNVEGEEEESNSEGEEEESNVEGEEEESDVEGEEEEDAEEIETRVHKGIAPFLLNEYGKTSIDNLEKAFAQFLEQGMQIAIPGQMQDFYGENYNDFFFHIEQKRKTVKLFNNPVRYNLTPNEESYMKDYKIFKSVVENTEQLSAAVDLKSLDAQEPSLNWSTIVRFALYEKYNYLLPAIQSHLGTDEWNNITDNKAFDDFVYVYCTLFTIIFQDNNFVFA